MAVRHPKAISYRHKHLKQWNPFMNVWKLNTWCSNIPTPRPLFVSCFSSGSILKFLLDHACSSQRCSNFCFYSSQASKEPIAGYCHQAIQIPLRPMSLEKSIDPNYHTIVFKICGCCANCIRFAEICLRFVGCLMVTIELTEPNSNHQTGWGPCALEATIRWQNWMKTRSYA